MVAAFHERRPHAAHDPPAGHVVREPPQHARRKALPPRTGRAATSLAPPPAGPRQGRPRCGVGWHYEGGRKGRRGKTVKEVEVE